MIALVALVCSINPIDLVDTRIGTGGLAWGVGGQNPGAQVPYGAMRLGPDTSKFDGSDIVEEKEGVHYGGYWYNDTHVRAFSHTHMVGAGVADFGNIGVMPCTKGLTTSMVKHRGWLSAISHTTETAKPGYYSTQLQDHNTLAELSVAGTHTGFHRYSFAKTGPLRLDRERLVLFDACHTVLPHNSDGYTNKDPACADAKITIAKTAGTNIIHLEGYVYNRGDLTRRSAAGGVHVYFVANIEPASDCGGDNVTIGEQLLVVMRSLFCHHCAY
jgi:hypothetical protein